jgi:hypothetical protein
MSYGLNFPACSGATGDVGKVLLGAKPADIPVEQPTKLDLTNVRPWAGKIVP